MLEPLAIAFEEQNIANTEVVKAITNITENSTEIESISVDTDEISKKVASKLEVTSRTLFGLNKLNDQLKEKLSFFKLKA